MPPTEVRTISQPGFTAAPWRWDLFCRVVDNYGDLGVCRRLAWHLAALGQAVRLWVDDPALMARMAPEIPRGGVAHDALPGVVWCAWPDANGAASPHGDGPAAEPGDVVVEAFGCNPPADFVQRMAERQDHPPTWINLEYLSAEDYVRRSHGLPSPQWAGPGRGLTKWFFYPGFTEGTGGLLREQGLMKRRITFDRHTWLAGLGVTASACRVVALFAYPRAPLEALLDSLSQADTPTALLITQGPMQDRTQRWLDAHPAAGQCLQLVPLPWLSSEDFDHLLWSADLNLVRGEDSLTRALWAGSPFIWQIYAQDDGVHAAKLKAFWDWLWHREDDAQAGSAQAVIDPWWRAWNGLAAWPAGAFPWGAWDGFPRKARQALADRPPLAEALLAFVAERREADSRIDP